MKVVIMKKNRKWAIYNEEHTELYIGKSRVECFRYALANEWIITAFQHGGYNK